MKIAGMKRQFPCDFVPVLEDLDCAFGENKVCPGYSQSVRNRGPELTILLKPYDHKRRAHVLHATKYGTMQVFYLSFEENERPRIEEFIMEYSR